MCRKAHLKMADSFLEYSEGAALIVEDCEQLADQLNLDLSKSPYWVSSISAASLLTDKYDLIVDSELGSVKIVFTRNQIEDYPVTNKSAVEDMLLSSLKSI